MPRRTRKKSEEEEVDLNPDLSTNLPAVASADDMLPAEAGGDAQEDFDEPEESAFSLDDDDLEQMGDYAEFGEEGDLDMAGLNDPNTVHLDPSPRIGGSSRSELFGQSAQTSGRFSSPKLYAQASQFPSCTQLRVWKWENGIPVGLGVIDSEATEEDFVRQFLTAMPRQGEGRCQYKLRPIDIRGVELGQEISVVISEHHNAIQMYRGDDDGEEDEDGRGAYGEMNEMFQRAMGLAEDRARALEEALHDERERLRDEDSQRAQERVDLASNAAQGVQAVTERLMKDEALRADRAMQQQAQQNQTLVTTLTSIFNQQQTMMQGSMEVQRQQDAYRIEQERLRVERERQEAEERRRREREEAEYRRKAEGDEAERKIRQEREFMELRLQREAQMQERRERAEREERQLREQERARQHEMALKQAELQAQRDREHAQHMMQMQQKQLAEERQRMERAAQESDARRERERDLLKMEQREKEAERQRQHDLRLREMDARAARDKEHAERMFTLTKQEASSQGINGIVDMLPKITKTLGALGLDTGTLVGRVLGTDGGGGGDNAWNDLIPKVLGNVSEVAAEAMKAKVANPRQIKQTGQLPLPQVPTLPPSMLPAGNPYAQAFTPSAPADVAGFEEALLGMVDEPGVPEQPQQEIPAPDAGNDTLSAKATTAGLQLKAQKNARVALRKAVKELTVSPEEKWFTIVANAIQMEGAIYHYVQAVTVFSAIMEAGADRDMTVKLIQGLKESGIMPADLNYGVE